MVLVRQVVRLFLFQARTQKRRMELPRDVVKYIDNVLERKKKFGVRRAIQGRGEGRKEGYNVKQGPL